jgi:hypothetical protein
MATTTRRAFDFNIELTPELAAEIVKAVELGNHVETAAMVIGVAPKILERWLEKGSRLDSPEPYRSFALGIRNAWAKAEREMVDHIRLAGVGDPTFINRFGETQRDWKALAWLLERRDPKRWGMQIQVNVREELTAMLAQLEANLKPEEYERVLAIIAGDRTPQLPAAIDVTPGAIRVGPEEEQRPTPQTKRKKEPPPTAH